MTAGREAVQPQSSEARRMNTSPEPAAGDMAWPNGAFLALLDREEEASRHDSNRLAIRSNIRGQLFILTVYSTV
jgi:hypothetical protein